MSCNACPRKGTFTCSVCKITRYCSHECQRADMRDHAIECKENLANVINMMSSLRQPTGRGTGSAGDCSGCGRQVESGGSRQGQFCKDCGYRCCQSCSVHHTRGTCRCYKSNFGRPYCGMEPREYHGSQASMYRGDRHPKGDYPPDAYERMTRRCENCGEVKQLLRKDYLYPEAYQKSYGFSKITMGVVGLAVWWYLFK